jgi:hypothetical protein
MSTEDLYWLVAGGRVIERLAIVGIGYAALRYGFELFKIVANHVGQLEAEGKGVKLRISQVGPGVFFAVFGVALVITSLAVVPKLEFTFPVRDESGSEAKAQYYGAAGAPSQDGEKKLKRRLTSINSLEFLASKASLSEAEKQTLGEALSGLEPVKASLIDGLLDKGRFQEWQQLKQMQTTAPAEFHDKLKDPSVLKRFQEVDDLSQIKIGEE